jgi:hypothetical protein
LLKKFNKAKLRRTNLYLKFKSILLVFNESISFFKNVNWFHVFMSVCQFWNMCLITFKFNSQNIPEQSPNLPFKSPFRKPPNAPLSWLKPVPKSVLQITPSKSPIAPPFCCKTTLNLPYFCFQILYFKTPKIWPSFGPKSSKNYALTLMNSNEQANSNAKWHNEEETKEKLET